MFRTHSTTGKLVQVCRACENASNLARFHNKPSTKKSHRLAGQKYNLKRYGLTIEMFDQMRADQDYRCLICKRHEIDAVKGTLSVDHCHETGAVRGLLCHQCNAALGHLQEKEQVFDAAFTYMQERNPAWQVGSSLI